jgi:hypothetical protein
MSPPMKTRPSTIPELTDGAVHPEFVEGDADEGGEEDLGDEMQALEALGFRGLTKKMLAI